MNQIGHIRFKNESKVGIFMHWEVFSVLAFCDAWLWYRIETGKKAAEQFMEKNYRPDWTYAGFAPQFTTDFFDPDHLAEIFRASGAKRVALSCLSSYPHRESSDSRK